MFIQIFSFLEVNFHIFIFLIFKFLTKMPNFIHFNLYFAEFMINFTMLSMYIVYIELQEGYFYDKQTEKCEKCSNYCTR